MCGVLGMAAAPNAAINPALAKHVLVQLMYLNHERGGDSCGLGIANRDEKLVKLFKSTGSIIKGLDDGAVDSGFDEAEAMLDGNLPTAVIGHNRLATTGACTVRNAHPFLCGRPQEDDFIVGAHNGIVRQFQAIRDEWKIPHHVEVDSEIIFRGMQHLDEDDVFSQIMPMGSLAATYMTDFNHVKLFRDDTKPLNLAIAHEHGYIFWSSLYRHLKQATHSLPVKYYKVNKRNWFSWNIDDAKLYKLDVIDEADPPVSYYSTGRAYGYGSSAFYSGYEGVDWDDDETDTKHTGSRLLREYKEKRDDRFFRDDKSPDDGETVVVRSPYESDGPESVVRLYSSCEMCDSDPAESWRLLWYDDVSLCPSCYFWLIMYNSEIEQGEAWKEEDV